MLETEYAVMRIKARNFIAYEKRKSMCTNNIWRRIQITTLCDPLLSIISSLSCPNTPQYYVLARPVLYCSFRAHPTLGPEPVRGMSAGVAKRAGRDWTTGLTHAKGFLQGPSAVRTTENKQEPARSMSAGVAKRAGRDWTTAMEILQPSLLAD
jgi:hypothetical protein